MKIPGIQNISFKKIFISASVLILLSFCLNVYSQAIAPVETVKINSRTFRLEVADNDFTRTLGLMYRENLDENSGMIFLFDKSDEVAFWMKNVKIPLDILFISGNKIVNIYKRTPICKSDPCPIYPSKNKVDYVIELKGGTCDINKIEIGQKIYLNKNIQARLTKLRKQTNASLSN